MPTSFTATATMARQRARSRRATRRARRALGAELAHYANEADRLEIQAIIGRHSAEESAEVRAILGMQPGAAAATPRPGYGTVLD
jgi:hypothetical protein